MSIGTSIGGNHMLSFVPCLRHFLRCNLPITTRPSWIRYTIMSTRLPLRSRRMQTILTILYCFRRQRRTIGKNGYAYPDSSTEESDYDEDIGPGDDLDDSDKWSNAQSNNDSKNGTLSRKILYAFKRRWCVIESEFSILAWFCCMMPEVRKDVADNNIGIHKMRPRGLSQSFFSTTWMKTWARSLVNSGPKRSTSASKWECTLISTNGTSQILTRATRQFGMSSIRFHTWWSLVRWKSGQPRR